MLASSCANRRDNRDRHVDADQNRDARARRSNGGADRNDRRPHIKRMPRQAIWAPTASPRAPFEMAGRPDAQQLPSSGDRTADQRATAAVGRASQSTAPAQRNPSGTRIRASAWRALMPSSTILSHAPSRSRFDELHHFARRDVEQAPARDAALALVVAGARAIARDGEVVLPPTARSAADRWGRRCRRAACPTAPAMCIGPVSPEIISAAAFDERHEIGHGRRRRRRRPCHRTPRRCRAQAALRPAPTARAIAGRGVPPARARPRRNTPAASACSATQRPG